MNFLRVAMMLVVGLAGAFLGIEVVESTLAAWWIGATTSGILILIMVGA